MMDLTISCPHCNAPPEQFCSDNCEVNGKKIIELKENLFALDLFYDEKTLFKLFKIKLKGIQNDTQIS